MSAVPATVIFRTMAKLAPDGNLRPYCDDERSRQPTYRNGAAQRSFSKIGPIYQSRRDVIFLVNASNIVRCYVGSRCNQYSHGRDCDKTLASNLPAIMAQEFGNMAAPELVKLYEAYFNTPAHFNRSALHIGLEISFTTRRPRRMLLTYLTDALVVFDTRSSSEMGLPRVLFKPVLPTGKDGFVS